MSTGSQNADSRRRLSSRNRDLRKKLTKVKTKYDRLKEAYQNLVEQNEEQKEEIGTLRVRLIAFVSSLHNTEKQMETSLMEAKKATDKLDDPEEAGTGKKKKNKNTNMKEGGTGNKVKEKNDDLKELGGKKGDGKMEKGERGNGDNKNDDLKDLGGKKGDGKMEKGERGNGDNKNSSVQQSSSQSSAITANIYESSGNLNLVINNTKCTCSTGGDGKNGKTNEGSPVL